jgi:hypothetical protein
MKPARLYLGLFLVTASTLMLQIIQTRILSVVLWYYLAFLIISLAMFGITAGAVFVYGRRTQFSERTLSTDLAHYSNVLAVVTAVCGAVQINLPLMGMQAVSQAIIWTQLIACLTLPFFVSGIVVSLALTRSALPIGRVYAVDLAGAAAGSLGVLLVLNLTDGPSAILWIAAMNALAAICFARSGGKRTADPKRPFAALLPRPEITLALLVIAALANGMTQNGLRLLFVKTRIEVGALQPVFTEWNTFARIAAFESKRHAPSMWGPSPAFRGEDWLSEERWIDIDGNASTVMPRFDGDISRLGFLKYDVTNIAHYLPGHRRAAVIGVGGGRDVLSARLFGVPDITGVELNPVLIRLLTQEPRFTDYSGINRLDGLHFNVDEARSWFARSDETFDIIQMSLVDTWAATGAGAFSLSENGLYTVEGWRTFINHLTPNGVFTVSRWYAPENVDEIGRAVSLANAALLDLGVDNPRDSIFLVGSGPIATMVISRTPFSESALALLKKTADDLQYRILLAPGMAPVSDVLGRIAEAKDRTELLRYTSGLPLDLTPATDNRPFFFNQLPLADPGKMVSLIKHRTAGVADGNIAASGTLLLLFVASTLLVLHSIVRPLRPAIADIGGRLAAYGTAYFLLIGIGFMCTEIGLLQRLSIFLGSPIYALSVVLFSVILTTGIGSLVSERLMLHTRARFVIWSAVTGIYLVLLPLWMPTVLSAFESADLVVRATICVLVVAPAGVLMGFGFPTGMRFVAAVNPQPLPWFWGINGAAGVLASSVAVAIGIAFGIPVTLMLGGLCYLLVIPAGLVLGFSSRATAD